MMNTILLLINLTTILIITYLLGREIRKMSIQMESHNETLFDAIGKLMLELKQIQEGQDKRQAELKKIMTSPNKVTQKPDKTVPLAEEVPWNIPPDVKVQVEGGDTNMPYGYGS